MFAKPPQSQDRLKKLARSLDTLAERDQQRLRREGDLQHLRRVAAADLHRLCATFVANINRVVTSVRLELTPDAFELAHFQDPQVNLFQINVSGRVIQLSFQATAIMESTEEIKTPYTLEGSVRWFNQELLDRDDIRDHRLFFCLDRVRNEWRFFDPRTHRLGAVDEEYLTGILEQLV